MYAHVLTVETASGGRFVLRDVKIQREGTVASKHLAPEDRPTPRLDLWLPSQQVVLPQLPLRWLLGLSGILLPCPPW